MLQVGFSYKSKIGGRALHHQERGYLHQAMNSLSEQLVALGESSSSGPEQLLMLQLKTGRTLHHQEKGYLHQATNSQSEQLLWARTAANASRGPEQLQKLQLQKQDIDRRQSIASSREGIFTPSYELTAAKARAASRHVGQCNARACQLQCQ